MKMKIFDQWLCQLIHCGRCPFLLYGLCVALFLMVAYGPTEGPAIANQTETSKAHSPSSSDPSGNHVLSSNAPDQSFEKLLDQLMPLTPEQIKRLRQRTVETGFATHGDTPHQIISRSVQYKPEPGVRPVQIDVTPGYVATVVITDATGVAWPISSYTVGQDKWFKIIQPDVSPKNRLTISSQAHGANSNVSITLKGLNTPVLFLLKSRPDRTNILTTIRVTRRGPNATEPLLASTNEPEIVNQTLLDFLDGVPPEHAQSMKLRPDVGGQIWKFRDALYLRTELRLISPAWSTMVSGEIIRVYKLPLVSVLLLSHEGRIRTVEVLSNE